VIVGGLLIVALVLGVILLSSLGSGTSKATDSTGTVAGAPTTAAVSTTVDDGIPATINTDGVIAFDPKGDQEEFNELLLNLFDGYETTTWHTECYDNQYTGAKNGVGIVLPMTKATTGALTVTYAAKPWSAELFVSDAIPSTLDGWGDPVDKVFSTTEVTGVYQLGSQPHTYVLLWLEELAPNRDSCSDKRPWQGQISEIAFTPGSGVG
jgi:hypothetical protein